MRSSQRLLELCFYHNLCITTTFFATKLSHRVSWYHPRSCHWHQLGLVITGRLLLNCILITGSYHNADCNTNHSVVEGKVHLQPKQICWSKQKGCPCICAAMTSMTDLCKCFTDAIEEALNDCHTGKAEEGLDHIYDVIYNSAMDTFGKREGQSPDWFEEGIAELELLITAKRAVLVEYKRDPSKKSLAALRKARNDA